MHAFFATCPKGLEELLATEMVALGAAETKQTTAGLHFKASWETAYRALMWSRLANRILFPLKTFQAADEDALYNGVKSVDWTEHMQLEQSFAVDATLSFSKITHSRFAALKVKDAVCDVFRDACGARPNVDREMPDLRLSLNIRGTDGTLYLDLSGKPLHERGYRLQAGEAPLKENLAAAILLRAGWPEIAAQNGSLVDPMCGSGTFLIEGLCMAADIAPGLGRKRFGVFNWKGFDTGVWSLVKQDAAARAEAGRAALAERKLIIAGFDNDKRVLERAENNIRRAGLTDHIQIGHRELKRWQPNASRGYRQGLVIVNPPYGERLSNTAALPQLYRDMGAVFQRCFKEWRVGVFTGNPIMGKQVGLRALKRYKLYNGAIACELLNFHVLEEHFFKNALNPNTLPPGAQMMVNRLRKNMKGLRKWVEAEEIEAYRIYDADIPEYNVAIDRYGDHLVIAEYAPPKGVDPVKAEARMQDVLLAVPEALGVDPEKVAVKQRKVQKKNDRYGRMDKKDKKIEVRENGMVFLVNPWDYLDTGLFSDHRPIRKRILEESDDKHFLNLFAYTGTATVAAILGGCRTSTTVDLSKTYLTWAEENLDRNEIDLGRDHRLVREDCMAWLKIAKMYYDLIFIDPPTFSNSKSFHGSFDVQRDHVFMLQKAAERLADDGLIIFSNNNRRFKLDFEELEASGLEIKDITEDTIPFDYKSNPKIHQCFEIRHKEPPMREEPEPRPLRRPNPGSR